MRNHYNFNFIWECNSCCHITILEPNSAAALPLETVPLTLAGNGKGRILHVDKCHIGQKEKITKSFTAISEAKRHFSAQARDSALWGRWNQINQMHKFRTSSQAIHISEAYPTAGSQKTLL